MANPQRLRRVADQIQRELSAIVRVELKDPRVQMVTLTGVELSPDLAHAKVFFTSLADAQREEAHAGLNRAAGFLRAMLGARIKTHNTPELHFIYDDSVEAGFRLDRLIDQAVASDAALKSPPRQRKRRARGS
jgi:ribosome-binding factor A